MIDPAEHGAEELAVGNHAADADAAEIHAVIAALAADEPGPGAIALHAMIGKRDLERGIGGFRSGVAEERVIEIAGRQSGEPGGELEHLGMAELESRREIKFGRLLLDRLDDRRAAMSSIGAPQSRGRIDYRPAGHVVVIHVLGAGDEPRPLLE